MCVDCILGRPPTEPLPTLDRPSSLKGGPIEPALTPTPAPDDAEGKG